MTSPESYENLLAALSYLQSSDDTSIASFRGRNFTLDGKAEELTTNDLENLAGQEQDPREDILMILTDEYLEAFLPWFELGCKEKLSIIGRLFDSAFLPVLKGESGAIYSVCEMQKDIMVKLAESVEAFLHGQRGGHFVGYACDPLPDACKECGHVRAI
jgi:hypothetical protein